MSTARRWSWLIAAALCVIAIAAILIVIPTRRWHNGAPPIPDPLAPGLAALSDQQLAELLPKRSEFPASWAVKDELRYDSFGYFRPQPFHDGIGPEPAECSNVGELAVGASDAAVVSAYDPAGTPSFSYEPHDIRVTLAREFNRSGFDAMIKLVSRCERFDSGRVVFYAVRILEDSRPANGPQRFRIVKTRSTASGDARVARTEYFSYARTSRLVLRGYARTGNQQLLDALFDNTLRRLSAP
ncbi:hypothetical protein A5791_14760 [Mycobacterium sp. 852002-51163_SCH5372311]|uniref:hypothetical protein n=1 Tax=Mycobacterium sp. 852002-51163_SCH5372311 TaxID=1834097 RepID=UPI0007FB8EA4|nr:hypothetical protein [Mycobacterium sp. 852002-51163_SCH5372311]OBF91776.1 hypothetical protein A5791_14760 [Mycobacterium sp. 852002-51163_SCH5372311]